MLCDLAKKYSLSNKKRVNYYIIIKDLKKQIKIIISITKKSFKLGELHILAILFLLLLTPIGARSISILRMWFRDI